MRQKRRFFSIFAVLNISMLIIIVTIVWAGSFNELVERDFYKNTGLRECIDLTGNKEISYEFENNYQYINNLIFEFTNCEGHKNGVLKVKIYDIQNEYYSYEIPIEVFESDMFYLFTNELPKLDVGKTYYISIIAENFGEEIIYLNCIKENYINILSSNLNQELVGLYPVTGGNCVEVYLSDKLWIILKIWQLIAFIYLFVGTLIVWYRKAGREKLRALYYNLINTTKTLPKYIYIQAGILVIISLVIVGAVIYYGDELILNQYYASWTIDNVEEFTNIPVKDGEIVQPFITEYDFLEEIILGFDNFNKSDEAVLWVQVVDAMDEIYYSWSGNAAQLREGGDTYWLTASLNRKLDKNHEYYIKIFLDNPQSDITVRAVCINENDEFLKDVLIDGVEQNDTFCYVNLKYIQTDSLVPSWFLIFFITLVVFLIIVYKNYSKLLEHMLIVALIFVSYYNIENLSRNFDSIGYKYALVNLLIILTVYLFLRAVLSKAAYYVSGMIFLIIGMANYYVLQFRGTELLFSDINSLSTAVTVMGNYSFEVSPEIFTSIIMVICLYFLQFTLNYMQKRIEIKQRGKHIIFAFSSVIMIALIGIYMKIDMGNVNFWLLSSNFSKYGWCYTNIILSQYSFIEKPQGYSKYQIEEIVSAINQSGNKEDFVKPQNLIVIMNESLSNLGEIGILETNKDYMPFIHSLSENVVKGNLHVSTFGGNTCITEYEFLTGNSQHFLLDGSIPYSVACEEEEPGLCEILKKQDYYSVAMHPYGGTNWNRNEVYPAMGFDEFIDIDGYHDSDLIRYYVSDKADYDKIIDYYEKFDKEKNLFIFNVTMQNHGGFDVNNGVIDNEITINNFESSTGETYLSLVYESDKAFEYLLSYFSDIDEPTMIVMFGDHLPKLPDSFYVDLYGKELDERSTKEKETQYFTPYIIWTNYDSNFPEISDISANYLGSFILKCAGLEMTEYNSFLLELRNRVPVIGKYGIYNAEGDYIEYKDMSPDVLSEYYMLQYMRIRDRNSPYYNIFSEIGKH